MILAHGLVRASLEQWTFEPVTIALLAGSAGIYAAGVRRVWRQAGRGRGIRRWEATAFALGIVSMAVALLSPLAWLSDIVFSAHMTQHEVLMLVAAPLLAMSQPLVAFLWAFDRRARLAARAFRWRRLAAPFPVFALHALTLWIWHVPQLYEWALVNQGVHVVQHLSFLLTAALFWWGLVHGRYGRAGYGVAVFYVFLTAIHSSVLGALATVSDRVWYPSYEARGAVWRVDPLTDQQMAGLIMWIPSGIVFIVIGLALLAAWLGESERRARVLEQEFTRSGAHCVSLKQKNS